MHRALAHTSADHPYKIPCECGAWSYDHHAHVERETTCHCGDPVRYGFDGDPTHTRGMCGHCDSIRCDAYPGECGR